MNEEAFAQIVPRLRRCAIRAGRRVGATETEAEDIAQDVMLRLWQMRNDLGRFVSLEGLVARMAHNLTLNLRRAGNAETIGNSETDALADAQLSPSDVFGSKGKLGMVGEKNKGFANNRVHHIIYAAGGTASQ